MQIGLMFEGQMGLNWEHWKKILTIAEDAGYQSVFRSDHFCDPQGPFQDALELWTSLTYAATVTQKIEFGPLVTPITFRHPALLAQYGAAVDVLSAGRLVFGFGIGWSEREHTAFDIDFPARTQRYERLEDTLEIVTRLYKAEAPISYEGKHFALKDAQITMKRPDTKILIGGRGPKKTLPLVAKYADEWNSTFMNYDDYIERGQLLDSYLEDLGRQPEAVKRSMMIHMWYGKDDAAVAKRIEHLSLSKEELQARGLAVGTGSEIVDILGKWQDAGLERVMLQWVDYDHLEELYDLAADVLPHFHK